MHFMDRELRSWREECQRIFLRSVRFSGQGHMYNLSALSQGRKCFSLKGHIDSPGITDIHLELVSCVSHGITRVQKNLLSFLVINMDADPGSFSGCDGQFLRSGSYDSGGISRLRRG